MATPVDDRLEKIKPTNSSVRKPDGSVILTPRPHSAIQRMFSLPLYGLVGHTPTWEKIEKETVLHLFHFIF